MLDPAHAPARPEATAGACGLAASQHLEPVESRLRGPVGGFQDPVAYRECSQG